MQLARFPPQVEYSSNHGASQELAGAFPVAAGRLLPGGTHDGFGRHIDPGGPELPLGRLIESISGTQERRNGLVDLATFAHDYALSHNATTALVGVTSSSNASTAQYRAFVVLANNQGVWSQVSNWYHLPSSTVMSSNTANTFLAYQNGGGYGGNYPQTFIVPSTSASALTLRGAAVNNSDNTGFAYLIFFPDGHIDTTGSSAINMRLVNAQNQATGSPADYYDLIFNPMTGTVKISQP